MAIFTLKFTNIKLSEITPWNIQYLIIILAVSTAMTILRVNQIIMAKAAGGPKAPSQRGGHWDDDHDDIE